MELKYAFLATAAEYAAAPDGRLALIGGDLDTLWFTSHPLVYPSLAVVVKLRLSPDEVESDHFLEVALVDSGGGTLMATPPLPVPSPQNASNGVRPAESGMVATLMDLTFPMPGEYRVNLAVDGRQIVSLPLRAAVREGA